MKFFICFAAIMIVIAMTESRTVDCDFDERKPFCGWRREWLGRRKAGWKSGNKIRRFQLDDHTSGTGKFIYFLARSRPLGFQSRLRSSATSPAPDTCLTFWMAMGGSKQPFPLGNAVLNLYIVGEGDSVDSSSPVWNKTDGTLKVSGYEKIVVPLKNVLPNIKKGGRVQFVFETVRGKSKKSIVAIDDVILTPCSGPKLLDFDSEMKNSNTEAGMKMQDVEKTLYDLMLPAKRPEAKVMRFADTSSGPVVLNGGLPARATTPTRYPTMGFGGYRDPDMVFRKPSKLRKRKYGRRGPKRSGRKSRKNKARAGNVYLSGQGRSESFLLPPVAPTSPTVLCDFMEYTKKLGRCFRDFFSALQRRPRGCVIQYEALESCLRVAALSCVPEVYMAPSRVEEMVLGALRDNLQTKKVFCKEDGAFVYPQFAVDKLPIQCNPRYFIKLSECSGSFSSMFHIQHGDPQLCRVYYKANQCQRQVTAEECNFDVETMLLYGLNLQYQIAHNPFCLNLSFSSWWPEY